MDKKAQLGMIEFKYMMIGVVIGIILTIVVVMLGNSGILPFKLSFLCPAVK